jgi:hypothetical protein
MNDQIESTDLAEDLLNLINQAAADIPQDITLTANGSFVVAAKTKLMALAFNPTANMQINIGLTNGGNELGTVNAVANEVADIDFGRTFFADTPIYVTGITASVELLIFKI